MNADQSVRFTVAFARGTSRSSMAGLCTACVEVLGVTGAGLALIDTDPTGSVCASDPDAAALEHEQYAVGLGPGPEASRSGASVHTPHLDAEAARRWPGFVEVARELRISAAFAYPLSAQGVALGVLTLYQRSEGPLSPSQVADAVALVAVLTETLRSLQDDAPPAQRVPVNNDGSRPSSR